MKMAQLAIIGAGPIGIEFAVACKKAGIDYLHFEAGQVGSTMFWWPPGTRWFSSNERIAIAGLPLQTVDQNKSTREEYLRYLRTVVLDHDLQINTFEPVSAIEKSGDGFVIKTQPWRGEQRYRAERVVLATGGTARPRKINVPGEDLPHVSHYLEDPHKYFRQRVLIVGGKNSAVEAALRLHNCGAKVTMSYRRSEFDSRSIKYWLYPEIKSLIKSGQIIVHFNTVVQSITPQGATLAGCDPTSFQPQRNAIDNPADFVLLLVGYMADMSLARSAGIELQGRNEIPVFDAQTMQTNVPGLYIAGTAVAGTQERYQVFLENCHIHVQRILADITGAAPPQEPLPRERPET